MFLSQPVDVQVQVAQGMPAFTIVGLPDKAVSEARERVRSAMIASGLALPAPHHHQPRARRSAQGRQPLRPADRARPDGGHRRHSARCLVRFCGLGRTRPRRFDCPGCRRAARRHRRQCPRRGFDLPGGLRTGSRLGEPGYRDCRGIPADPARQSLQGHAGAVAAAAQNPRSQRHVPRPCRHQGPGNRQARTRGGRRRWS